jgi:ribose 1,5-bisphosphokinase
MMPICAGQMPRIGPGRLVVVVGPSGAGKDTLLALARDRFCSDRHIVFPRRIVTREPSAAEDNEGISETDFAAAVAAGGFAFWWDAHGLKYALGAAIDDDIRAGKAVVCNVSRTIVVELRRRYANVRVVLVTAPADILAARLTARGRTTDGAIGARLGRTTPSQEYLSPELVIENVGDLQSGAAKLIAAIDRCRV